MAVWQYKFYLLPRDELDSYFPNQNHITESDFNDIKWWKYQKIMDLDSISMLLPKRESWSSDIILFGSEDSNCLEILTEAGEIAEISARMDVRKDYLAFLTQLCNFAAKNNCILLNDSLNLFLPDFEVTKIELKDFERKFKNFSPSNWKPPEPPS
jgi:hypothetical protein